MIKVIRAYFDSNIPLTWKPLKEGDKRSASFICPNRHYGVLLDHDIAPDGTVSPYVVCPEKECEFHDYIKLVGWEP